MTVWQSQPPDHLRLDSISRPTELSAPDFALPLSGQSMAALSHRLLTQPADEIATHFRWSLGTPLGCLLDATGEFIALTRGDAMIAMLDLGWISLQSCTVNWSVVPSQGRIAANDVRVFLDIDGTAYSTA